MINTTAKLLILSILWSSKIYWRCNQIIRRI